MLSFSPNDFALFLIISSLRKPLFAFILLIQKIKACSKFSNWGDFFLVLDRFQTKFSHFFSFKISQTVDLPIMTPNSLCIIDLIWEIVIFLLLSFSLQTLFLVDAEFLCPFGSSGWSNKKLKIKGYFVTL